MYYVIAAAYPSRDDAKGVLDLVRSNCAIFQEPKRGNNEVSFIGPLDVEKSEFKIGSLDQLMVLNETAAKLDVNLEVITKKIERVVFETNSENVHDLEFVNINTNKTSK
jgi:hypothetical protein